MSSEKENHARLFSIFPDCDTWEEHVAAARAMVDEASDNLHKDQIDAVEGMKRLQDLIYRNKFGVTTTYTEFRNNTLTIFNGSVEYAQSFSAIPANIITRGGKEFLKFTTPSGVMNLRDVKLIVDAYGLVREPIPVKQLGMKGMSNPNSAVNDARFQLSLALRDRFRK